MPATIEEFMKQLDSISEYKGVPFARAHLIFDAEDAHSNAILQFKGYLSLSDAFKCFFLETIELINVESRPKVKKALSEHYAMFVPRVAHNFRAICGAERVAIKGYPYQGYTLLRNIFDNVILVSAALQKLTDFYSIEGVVPGKPFQQDEAKKLRKKTEFAIRKQMTGDQSGLSAATVDEVGKWDAMFDMETHGALLSATYAIDWMKGQGNLSVLAKYDEMAFAMFMNRFCEVAWMLHRVLPALQPPDATLSDEWVDKWRILDECFRQEVVSLTDQLGKAIGGAIVELVTVKFPFNSKSAFPL